MKNKNLLLVLSSVLLSSVAAAESNPLTCKVTVTQTRKGDLLSGRKLIVRTAAARRFSGFTLDPKEGDGQAWIHQNQCVSKHDFKNGTFEGPLCVFVMTHPEKKDPAFLALNIEVAREAVSIDDLDDFPPSSSKSNGGVRALVPLNPDGKSFIYSQRFATTGAKGELQDLTISCSAS